ncbi:CLUMA_CG005827, isoform A [Clunio marinus]|uniref:CLUMA_CG005827, isoform A n=1 Tax=Clunio marinus TaxID=568069 RepID=A0A1J1I1E0_9DIPT|nr:CLUMA_CG005827, isoform A [Clunio marinus]
MRILKSTKVQFKRSFSPHETHFVSVCSLYVVAPTAQTIHSGRFTLICCWNLVFTTKVEPNKHSHCYANSCNRIFPQRSIRVLLCPFLV